MVVAPAVCVCVYVCVCMCVCVCECMCVCVCVSECVISCSHGGLHIGAWISFTCVCVFKHSSVMILSIHNIRCEILCTSHDASTYTPVGSFKISQTASA